MSVSTDLSADVSTTSVDVNDFASLGYLVTNADSNEAVGELIPSAEDQKESENRISVSNIVTPSLWRAFDSTMNQDVQIKKKIKFGGELINGYMANQLKRKSKVSQPILKLRNTLYNRTAYINKNQSNTPNKLTKTTLQTPPPMDNFYRNDKYNPQKAQWRHVGNWRTPMVGSSWG